MFDGKFRVDNEVDGIFEDEIVLEASEEVGIEAGKFRLRDAVQKL